MYKSMEAVSRVEATAAERHAVAMNDAMGGERAPFLQTFNPHRRHRPALKVATCARLAATARALLGVPEVQLYQSCLFKKRAGDEATNWHSDLHTSPLDTNQFVTCWFPLHDLEADSTGLCYATGSHRDLALPMWYGQDGDCDGRYDVVDHGAYAPGDARPASARVADHIDRLGGLVDALWNPQLEKLRAKIASATVVDRRRPS